MKNPAHITAIIGFGGMGGWHLSTIRDRVPELTVKGVYDIRPQAAQKAQEEGLYAYQSSEELLEDREVQLVIIAVPNNFHKDYAIRCLRAGKHVICEKPVTMNARELEEILEVQKETGKVFTVHQNRRWDRDYATVRSILSQGTVGAPYFIESRVQGSRRAMFGWRGHKPNGGGMLYDWGVHLLDQLMDLILEPVTSVTAHLVTVFSDEVDDNCKILLEFESGISALVEVSTNCFINLPRWHISCAGGTIAVEDWDCRGEIVQLAQDGEMSWEDDIVYTSAGPTRTMAPRPAHTTRRLQLPKIESDSADYYCNVAAVIEGKEELIVRPEQCLRVMKVIDLAFLSHEKGVGLACHI